MISRIFWWKKIRDRDKFFFREIIAHCEKLKFHSNLNFFRQIIYVSNFISKNVVFTKFMSKKSESQFPRFPQYATL